MVKKIVKFLKEKTGYNIIKKSSKQLAKISLEDDAIAFLKKAKKTKKFNTFKWNNFSKYYMLTKKETEKLKQKYYD